MTEALFTTQTFAVDGTDKVAGVVLGFRAKIKRYAKLIKMLQAQGYSVIIYEFDPLAITGGDPYMVPKLIDGIVEDFRAKIKDYDQVICIGMSVGAGIGFYLQKVVPEIRWAIYAVAGVSPSERVFGASLFFSARKAFVNNGFTEAKLREIWHKYEVSPDEPLTRTTPFVMVLGARDKIVKYDQAMTTLRAWQAAGVPIQIITKQVLGHSATIKWLKKNITTLLKLAEEFERPA